MLRGVSALVLALAVSIAARVSAQTSDGPVGAPALPPGYAYTPATPPAPPAGPVVAPAPPDPERPPPLTAPPAPGSAPSGHRATGEMVELYVTLSAFGVWTGIYVPLVAGWARDAGRDEGNVYTASGLVTGAVFALLPLALDLAEDGGMPDGTPGAISMGLRYGLAFGAATLGIAQPGRDIRGDDGAHLLGWSTLAGGGIGALVGYGLRPHPAQVQFVQVTGIWGTVFGALAAVMIAPPFVSERDASRVGFAIGLGGFLGGIGLGTILAATDLNLGVGRSWLCTLALLAGAAGGTALWAIGSVFMRDFDAQGWAGAASIGALSALVLGLLLSTDDASPTHHTSDVAVSASLAPLEGGAAFRLDGAF